MTDEQLDRRNKVYRLLQETADLKRMKTDPHGVMESAEEAYKQATEPTKLDFPLPQLAAYRRAHLMLRRNPSEEDLEEIDQLLVVATARTDADTNDLGLVPTIYRLAVLQRLSLLAKTKEAQEDYREVIKNTFKRACQLVRAQNAAQPDKSSTTSRDPLLRGPIQNPHFNLLELATYFLGEEYQDLEGLGANRDIEWIVPTNKKAWILVGPNPSISEIHLHQKFVFAELDDRRAHDPAAIVFRLGENVHEWQKPRQTAWEDMHADELLILATVLRNPKISEDLLRKQVVDRFLSIAEGDRVDKPGQEKRSKAKYRQNKTRLREMLSEVSGLPTSSFFFPENHRNYIPPEVRIYGAVQLSVLPEATQ